MDYLKQLEMAETDVKRALEEIKQTVELSVHIDEIQMGGRLEVIQGILELASTEIFEVRKAYQFS